MPLSPPPDAGQPGEIPAVIQPIVRRYDERLSVLRAEMATLESRSQRISRLRGLTFLIAAAGGVYLFLPSSGGGGDLAFGAAHPAIKVVSALAALIFVGLVIFHAVLVTRMGGLELRITLFDRARRRTTGDFSTLVARSEKLTPTDHDYSGDLDLFGKGSLFQLLSVAETGEGDAMLADWLLRPASAEVVAERQEAVRELIELRTFREELAVLGSESGARGRDAEALIAWASSPPLLRTQDPLVRLSAVILPLTLAAFTLTQIVPPATLGLFRHAWLLLVGVQFFLVAAMRSRTEPTLHAASSREAPFGRYRQVLAGIEEQTFSSPLLQRLRAELRGTEPGVRPASEEMLSLQKILGYAELRHNALIHVILNIGLLWDVWCALALDRWRVRSGSRIRSWMQSLGQMEALTSLATFADENPDYAFPEVKESSPRFEARSLAHPLLPRTRRVANDVGFDATADGSDPSAHPVALLITGSNMSGKSTMLRSIGINTVLALAGAPVCAESLELSPLAVRTSMRISDSLEQGVSHFYAEVVRLKRVVDSANRGEQVLFLLDEILHGTNSRERILGAQAVVKHLIERGAIGAVSSHDLGLSPLQEETGGRVRNAHFEELVVEDKMSFDYTLKPGVVSTANALRLMRIAGIGVELPDG
ncbi:MutS family DNA mismatch repair protein [Chondromyces crocatus]|uniref:DNA mismatch repair protein MutS n=1 Tax=Chondromyces crocatus TaxID=52 RepID=A0A0K1EQF9_CHOCO|nr:MutS family DNA mismatch repair protein [Chondromyces crocatus]AKT43054.1 DNA mismatch repair protein MutS [Chondromyces crocatus]